MIELYEYNITYDNIEYILYVLIQDSTSYNLII